MPPSQQVRRLSNLQPGCRYRLSCAAGSLVLRVTAVADGIVTCEVTPETSLTSKPVFRGQKVDAALYGWSPLTTRQSPLGINGAFTNKHLLVACALIPGDARPLSQLIGPTCRITLLR